MQRTSRLKRELQLMSTEPPPGITCWQTEGQMDELRAQIVGADGTPFEGGVFSLEIKVPDRYPFEPPKMRFLTPIYHPNIDNAGRICHDALKLPPKGAWKPSLNISTVLTSIQLLMADPNPDDPLMADISAEFKYNKQVYLEKAKMWTEKHALQKNQGGVREMDGSIQAGVEETECSVQCCVGGTDDSNVQGVIAETGASAQGQAQPLAWKREAHNVCQGTPAPKKSCL